MQEKDLRKLLEDMSIEEKIGQLVQLTGGFYEDGAQLETGPMKQMGFSQETVENAGSVLSVVSAKKLRRMQENYIKKQAHHIPQVYMADIINGLRTVFPIPLAQGCTFNPQLSKELAAMAAKEAARAGLHVTFSPMVDLVRDARWGRVLESTGEDTYLNGLFSQAMVEGYQGDDVSKKDKVAACMKHFAGYGAPVGGREYNQVELSQRTLYEDYLPSYKAGIDAGAELVMTSFNTLSRVPSTANKELMNDLLREEWGFEGVVISDWAAIEELIPHGIAADKDEAACLAMNASVDMDMVTNVYSNHLKSLIESGKITMEQLDKAAYRILRLKNRLGLFENPFKDADEDYDERAEIEPENRGLARKGAVQSCVLLKNDGILPLSKKPDEKCKSIAFVGPYTDESRICGSWSIFKKLEDVITIKEGVEKKKTAMPVSFENGCHVLPLGGKISGFSGESKNVMTAEELAAHKARAIELAKGADVVVVPLGEHFEFSGEGASRTEITVPEHQMELFRKLYEVNKNIVAVTFSGRPLDLREINEKARAVLHVWFPGVEGGNAIADILFGDETPSGKLAMSFPYCVGQVPVYYNELHTGRRMPDESCDIRTMSRYLDAPNAPLFAFGYGLSYTTFDYSNITLDGDTLTESGKITAAVTVTNTGSRTGCETVQLYIHDIAGSVARPVRELKGFKKVTLQPGESEKVEFEINADILRFYTADMKYRAEAGAFELFIGTDSNAANRAEFKLIMK